MDDKQNCLIKEQLDQSALPAPWNGWLSAVSWGLAGGVAAAALAAADWYSIPHEARESSHWIARDWLAGASFCSFISCAVIAFLSGSGAGAFGLSKAKGEVSGAIAGSIVLIIRSIFQVALPVESGFSAGIAFPYPYIAIIVMGFLGARLLGPALRRSAGLGNRSENCG